MKEARPLRSTVVEKAARSKPRVNYHSEFAASLLPWPRDLPVGKCKGHPQADIFSSPFTHEELDQAIETCHDCPIKLECLRIGVQRKDTGVYGGKYLNRGQYLGQDRYGLLPKYRKR